jgi:mono/diheme cytochrome c family protein
MNVRGLVGALLPAFFVLDLGYFAGKRRSFDADQAIELSARNLPFRASRSGPTLTVRSTFSVGLPLIVFGRQLLGRQSGKHRPEPGDSGVGAVTYRMPTLSRILGAAFLLFGLALAPNAKPIEAQPTQVQRGEYLARAGDCISCHTASGGQALAGGGRLNTPFGYMLTPNITPDAATGIGLWSSDDFYRALHAGVNRAGEDMYPTMPYDFYTRVTRDDSDAIYAYLRTLNPVTSLIDVNHLHFPFDERWTMGGWRELYFTEGTFTPSPNKSAAWNRGAYLVEGLGHCSACHSPRNLLGAIEKNREFAGAVIDGWFALDLSENITTGLGSWSIDNIATYLQTGAFNGRTTAIGPMAEVVHNSLQYVTDSDLHAMAEYLKALPPDSPLRAGRRRPDATRLQGANLYIDHCVACHQSMGRGIPGVFPPLAGNGVVLASDPADIVNVVLLGIPPQNGSIAMPSCAGEMSDQQIAALANYVRTSWGNTAAPDATSSTVARLRIGNKVAHLSNDASFLPLAR